MGDLSADQRAILELLLVRGFSYEEIGEVTGIGTDEARARAVAGIEAIGGAAHAQTEFPDADAKALARLVTPRGRSLSTTVADRPRFPLGLVAAAAGAVCLVVAALAFAGVFSGDDDEEPAATPEEVVEPSEPVEVAFESPGGGEASGTATIGLDADSEPYLQLDVSKLPQAPAGEIYMLWVDDGLGRGLPLPSPLRISKDGALRQSFRVAAELIPILDLGKNLELITVDREQLQQLSQAVVEAAKDRGDQPPRPEDLPDRPGGVVLTGALPE